MQDIENVKAQMKKGVLELCVLSVLEEKELYPSDILIQLKQSDLIVVEGTIYPLLSRLKNAGFLSYRWVESHFGPPRKYFSLTPEGKTFLNELKIAWQELIQSIHFITKGNGNGQDNTYPS